MMYMPSGKDRKLARPDHGPYRVLNITPTNDEVVLATRLAYICVAKLCSSLL